MARKRQRQRHQRRPRRPRSDRPRPAAATGNRSRRRTACVPVRPCSHCRIDSMLAANSDAEQRSRAACRSRRCWRRPGRRCAGSMPRVAPIVRRIAMSRALVLHQHDQAGDDVEGRDQDDQRQDQEHDVALDLERVEEARVRLLPVEHAVLRAERASRSARPTSRTRSGLSTISSRPVTAVAAAGRRAAPPPAA